jgi:hypothetical protein
MVHGGRTVSAHVKKKFAGIGPEPSCGNLVVKSADGRVKGEPL